MKKGKKLSAEMRKKIGDAQRARWAKVRRGKKIDKEFEEAVPDNLVPTNSVPPELGSSTYTYTFAATPKPSSADTKLLIIKQLVNNL